MRIPTKIKQNASSIWAAIAFIATFVAIALALQDQEVRTNTRFVPIEKIVKGKPGKPGPAGKNVRELVLERDRRKQGTTGERGRTGKTGGGGARGSAGLPPLRFSFKVHGVTYVCSDHDRDGKIANCPARR